MSSLKAPRAKPATPPTPAPESAVPEQAFRRVRSETLVLPRAKAVEAARVHQELPNSPTERTLEPRRVNELTGRIKTGLLLPCNWATVTFDGVKYRMNGQHSSHAITEAADFLPDEVAIHLDHYEAADAVGMGVLFRQFDARFSSRSKQDVSGAYHGLVKELSGVARSKAKLGIEGATWYERSVEKLPVPSGDELYELFFAEKYHPFLRWLDKVLSIKTPELNRAPVVGAMYATFITSESGAQDFWAHVAKQDLPDDADPRAVLSAELVAVKEQKEVKLAPAEFYAKCIKSWNAFRSGDKIRSLNVNTKKGLPEIAA